MRLSSVSIQRPVLTIVLNLSLVLFGLIALDRLGVRDYPAIDPPIVSVNTSYSGANADVIESQITEPLEEAVNSVPGVRAISSTSRDGRSSISIEFDVGIDMEAAANDVRDKVSRAVRNLPPDADNPSISKADADARPIILLSILSDTRGNLELSALANDLVKERLQTIPGLSEARLQGERKYAIRLWLDPYKMAARGLSAQDVKSALDRANVELPSGSVEGTQVELTVRTVSRLRNPEEFNALILKEADGQSVRLGDVGKAELGAENARTSMKNNGFPAVGVMLIPQPGANHIAIADEFYARLEALKKDLPKDVKLSIGFDTTRFIVKSLHEVGETLLIALALVILIIFAFLRNWRTTLIPILAIPVSLLSAFFIMYLSGFSLNILTLLALVLSTGLVVDDAIVVLENIYTKVEGGMDPDRGRPQGVQRDLLRHRIHHAHPGRGVPAHHLSAGHHGAVVPGIRRGGGRGGAGLGVRVANPHPHVVHAPAPQGQCRWRLLPPHRTLLRRHDPGLPPRPGFLLASPLAGLSAHGDIHAADRIALQSPAFGNRPLGGQRPSQRFHHGAGRRHLRLHGRHHGPGGPVHRR